MLGVDGIASIKTVRLKQRSDPWMDNEILLAIRDRDNALQNFKKQNSPENHKIYCILRNKVQYKVRKTKQKKIQGQKCSMQKFFLRSLEDIKKCMYF